LPQGLYVKLDSVNELTWTVVPVVAVIILKFSWSTLDSYYRVMAPYISLSQRPAPLTLATNYQTTIIGWVALKSLFNRHYMLGVITVISLLNELLVVGTGGKLSLQFTYKLVLSADKPAIAFAKIQTIPLASEHIFVANLTTRRVPLEIVARSGSYQRDFDALEVSQLGQFYYELSNEAFIRDKNMAGYAISGGQTARWTTVDYAFCPLDPQEDTSDRNFVPSNVNLSVITTAISPSEYDFIKISSQKAEVMTLFVFH
jgi:hypothetical protein